MTHAERTRISARKAGGQRHSGAWPTITFAVPPSDYAVLRAIVARDRTRFSTLAREAVQSYLTELDTHLADRTGSPHEDTVSLDR